MIMGGGGTYSECRWVLPSRPCRCRWRCRPLRRTSRCSHRGPSHTSCSWLKTRVVLFWQTHRVCGEFSGIEMQRAADLCCRCCHPSPRGSCTGRSPRGRNTCLRYCRSWGRTGSHLHRGNVILHEIVFSHNFWLWASVQKQSIHLQSGVHRRCQGVEQACTEAGEHIFLGGKIRLVK